MKKIIYFNFYRVFKCTSILILLVLLSGTINAQEKPSKTAAIITVSLKVIDDNGSPVPNASIVSGEGIIHAETDEKGAYSFRGYPNDLITISASGYEKVMVVAQDILNNSTISLKKSKLYMTSDDDIPLPFITLKKRNLTGSAKVLKSNQLEKYPSTDLRNAFTGLVPGLQITEYDGSPGFSAEEELGTYRIIEKIGVNARGRNLMYIIDDIPVDITELTLDPQEIESVTIIKDIVGKAMYGPIAADGIVLIKTKRGRPNERILTVNAESGVSIIDRFPEWTTGADYARLNNQARESDELDVLYGEADIDAYAKNDPNDLYHPSVNFRDMMLKDIKKLSRVNVSSYGGNDVVQYSSFIGYNNEGDIYKIGPTADYNRITANSNVDLRINDAIKVSFDISAGLTLRRSPNYGYATTITEGGTEMDLIEISSVLPDITQIPPVAFPVYAKNDPSLKFPWFGVSSLYPINPVGNLINNGSYIETGRKGRIKFSLDYDLSKVLNGLKSESFVGFDVLDLLRKGKAENYWAYIATPSTTTSGADTILYSKAHDGFVTNTLSNLHDYYYQRFQFYEKLSFERSFGNHDIQTDLTYLLYKISKNGIDEPQRQQNAIWAFSYTNNDKYILQGVLNYAGTYSFEADESYKLFPSVGIGWIISEESFMSNMKFINFLKLRANAGILGYEDFISPFLYRDRWTSTTGTAFGPHSANQWFGKTTQTTYSAYPSRIGHPGLSWEKRKEFSIGIDGVMLNEKLSLEVNYYNNLRDGIITSLSNSLPYAAGISTTLPSVNYNQIKYTGIETGIQYSDKVGSFRYSIGANATISDAKYVKYNEPDYRFSYQFNTGKSIYSYWGQTYLGKFQNTDETLEVPQLYDAVLKEGDLKYKDMNGDLFVDDNDRSVIGHTSPRLYYGLNVSLSYSNFDLFVMGTGAAFYDIPLTNSYFWNGWGDNNYSNFVRDNIGGAYPRLTYYKVNNNFVSSDFWLTKGGYFKIQNVELAYNISPDKLQLIGSRGMRVFLRGANLLTLTKIKDVDPESINSGITTYPLYKTFTGGIKLTF